MSAISFAAFLGELALGYAMSHPAPFFIALGVTGTGVVFGIAGKIMARDDMPLSLADQQTVDVFAELAAELHHARPITPAPVLVQHAHARHARPGPLRRAAGRLAGWWHSLRQTAPEKPPAPEHIDAWVATLRHRTWAVDALAGQISMLPAAPARLALPAPTTGDGPAPVRAVTTHLGPAAGPTSPGYNSHLPGRPNAAKVDRPAPDDVPGRGTGQPPGAPPGRPPAAAPDAGSPGPAGDCLDYAPGRPFSDWLRDSVVMAAIGGEGT